MKTKYDRIKQKIAALQDQLRDIASDKRSQERQLQKYIHSHKSLDYGKLVTGDVAKLKKIYRYFDKRYPVEWQGGLRCDDRGMRLVFWVDDDPEYLNLHLTSTSKCLFLSGSTSWLVKAATLEDKIAVLKQIKKDITEVLK